MNNVLKLCFTNFVVSGIAAWGYIIGYESAAVAASVILWIVSVNGILAYMFSDSMKFDSNYTPRVMLQFVISISFDVANSLMAIYAGRPLLGAFILIGSSMSALYMSKKNKLTKSRGLCDN